jgi:hypothetical protein
MRDYPGIWEDDDDTWEDDSAETRNEAPTEPEQHWSRMKNVPQPKYPRPKVPQPKNDSREAGALETAWCSFWVAVVIWGPGTALMLLAGKFELALGSFALFWLLAAESNSPRRLR